MLHGLTIKIQEFQQDGYGIQLNGVDRIHFLHVITTLLENTNHVDLQNQLLNVKKNVLANTQLITVKICIQQNKFTAFQKM